MNAPLNLLYEDRAVADRRWMDLMVQELQGWSKHIGTKHVSVITGPMGEFRSLGYNGLPRRADDSDPGLNSHPMKRDATMCAERNALRNLELIAGPRAAAGCTLHADAIPCVNCAREILDREVATVVMVDAEVTSATHHDSFWNSGLGLLERGGVEIRKLDPSLPGYANGTVKYRHDPVPSGSGDWDSRFLLLARHAERWLPGGAGEVLAHRPSKGGGTFDKMVRALGCWSPVPGERAIPDVLETTALSGISAAGSTLYLSRPEPLVQLRRFLGAGISAIVLPREYEGHPVLRNARATAGDGGPDIHLHLLVVQDLRLLPQPSAEGLDRMRPAKLSGFKPS